MRRRLIVMAIALSVAGCTAVRQQKATSAVPDSAEFHNLQVLPANLTRAQLIATMRSFTGGLGVSCEHCHVRRSEGERDFDFASDRKNEKHVARTMLRMVRTINEDYVSAVNVYGEQVSCVTCHRGKPVPDAAIAEAASPDATP